MISLSLQFNHHGTSPDSLELAPGLIWIPQLLTITQQQRLLRYIQQATWEQPLWLPAHHYLQCYGWTEKPTRDYSCFDYHHDDRGELPSWVNTVQRRLTPWLPNFDQLIVHTTTAISPLTCPVDRNLHTLPPGLHLDSTRNYGAAIATVALSSLKLIFRRGMRDPITVELDAGDALIIRDEMRYQWLHRVVFNDDTTQMYLTLRRVKVKCD